MELRINNGNLNTDYNFEKVQSKINIYVEIPLVKK